MQTNPQKGVPLVLHETLQPAGEIGLWRIDETEVWFRDQLLLYPAELRQLSRLRGQGRRREWLAARQLVHAMSGREVRGAFIKDDYGKPHLEKSDWQISISHTSGFSGAIAAPCDCGIDVQVRVPRITRLGPRFLRPDEEAALPTEPEARIDALHLIWGTKEALYKAYGRREIDWREHLRVEIPQGREGFTQAHVLKDGYDRTFRVHYRWWQQRYLLVYVLAEF